VTESCGAHLKPLAEQTSGSPIRDFGRVRSGYAFKSSDWVASGVPVVKIGNVKDGRIDLAGCSYVSEQVAQVASEWLLSRGDVVIAMTGEVGEVAFVREDTPMLLNQRVGRFEITSSDLLPAYLFYALRQPGVKEQLQGIAHGSVQANLTAGAICSIEIPVRPMVEQEGIVRVLLAIDHKIDLNRRICDALERIAEAVFRSRFVDFDDAGELVESEIGWIPRGWAVKRVRDLADINLDSISTKSAPSRIRYVDIGSTGTRELGAPVALDFAEAPSRARRRVHAGDTLVSTVRPERRAMGFVPVEQDELVASTGFAVASPRSAAPTFVYRSVTSDECIEYLSAAATGSAYPAVNPSILADWRLAVPPDGGAEYEALAAPLELLRWNLFEQSRTLAELRDTLLPRLISGEVRVLVDPHEGETT
jgi:type I restriction enzyme S subunit